MHKKIVWILFAANSVTQTEICWPLDQTVGRVLLIALEHKPSTHISICFLKIINEIAQNETMCVNRSDIFSHNS